MSKKSLLETNLFLKDPVKYRKALITNVATSTAIETGASIESITRKLAKTEKATKIRLPRHSSR